MKKIFSFLLLMATMLLVSGNAWAVTHLAGTVDELNTAITAAETGDIVQLTADVAYPTNTSAPALSIDKQGVEFTLDLNGHNLTGGKASTSYGTIKMLHGTMTIISSVGDGSIGAVGTSQYVLNFSGSKCDGKIILKSGKICAKNYAVYLASSSKGTFVMDGGEIVVDGSTETVYGINQDSQNSSIEINGGKISIGVSTKDVAVYGIGCNSGSFTINNDAAMCVHNTGTSSSALTFTTKNGTVVINGGKFVAKGSTTSTSSTFFANTTKIFGGQFDRDVQDWVPTGEPYMCQTAGLGTCFEKQLTHEVVVNPAPVAYIRNVTQGKDYTSISAAFAEAADNDELCALQDMDFGVGSLTLDKAITFDINGRTLSANASVLYLTGGDVNHTLVLTDKAAEKGLISGTNTIQLKGGYVKVDGINVEGTTSCFNEATKGNYIIQDVVANVSATTYSAKVYGFVASASKTDINNCQFILDAAKINSSASTFASVFNFNSSAKCTVSINGGTYKVKNANVVNAQNNAGGIICGSPQNPFSINGGDFRVEGATDAKKVISTVTTGSYLPNLKIYGGTFNLNPDTWVADGFFATQADGIYTVAEGNVASVNGTEYASLDEAIAEAAKTAPASITLLHSTKVTTTLTIPAGVTFASNSKTMDLLASTPLKLEDGATKPTCIANPNFVATITDASNATYYFYALDKAVSASGSLTVQLISDITNAAAITITSGTKTIDFNGHNVACTADYMFTVSSGIVGGNPVEVNFINSNESESVLECTSDKLQSEGLRVQSKGTPIVVKVGQGVTIKGSYGVSVWKNATLNVYGKVVGKRAFAVCGNGGSDNGGTTINIYNSAELEGLAGIYHPQEGTLNISGGKITGANTAVEMRAGTLNVSGGSLVSTAKYQNVQGNRNGSTTTGAALSVVQHTTKLPINVTITGGEFEGYYPFYQANAQNNSAADVAKISLAINDGKFLCTNDGQNVIYSENFNEFVNGGLFSHTPSAYLATGKVALANDDPETLETYVYKVVDKSATVVEFITEGQWNNVNNWEEDGETVDEVPDAKVEVLVSADATIGNKVVADVYSATIADGQILTVENGGTLVIGAGGLTLGDDAQIIVEDGGVLAINPAAPVVRTNPRVKVALASEAYKFDQLEEGRVYNDYVWQDIAIPVKGVCGADFTFTKPTGGPGFFLNKWTGAGWTDVTSISQFAGNFQGFAFTNKLTGDATDKTFYFEGELAGVEDLTLTPSRLGFNFFGNSYLAPIDIKQLLLDRKQGFETAVSVYNPLTEKYEQITLSDLEEGKAIITKIKPMQGFFMFASSSDAEGTLSYTNAVWNVLNEAKRGAASAPARVRRISAPRGELTHTAKMNIKMEATASASFYDNLSLFESQSYLDTKDADYDVTQQISGGWNVNVFAVAAFGNMTELSQKTLENTYIGYTTGTKYTEFKFTFSNVAGEYYLLDHVTGEYTAIVEGATYTFTDAAKSGTTEIKTRFQIVAAPTYDVTTNVNGWATYCDDANLALPTGMKAYKAAYDAANEQLLLTEVDYIAANEGVIVYGAASKGYNFTLGTGSSDFADNELTGNASDEAMNTVGDDVYCMRTIDGVTLFAHYVGDVIPAHRGYFHLENPGASPAPARISVRIISNTGSATDIDSIEELFGGAEKYILNGTLYIEKDERIFDVKGQQVK